MRGAAIAAALIVALLLAGGAMLWLAQHRAPGGIAGSASIGGPFTLTDGDGKTVTDQTFRGKDMLVYFGYTYCPDVCPTTLTNVAAALDKLGVRGDRLVPVFITVDPRRDTPAVVKQYAAAFSPRIVGLTGTPEQIKAVAREYRVYYAEHRTGPGPDDYAMDHSSILYLMGPDGKFVSVVPAEEGADTIAADLARQLPSS
jgi:protein SCO1/2